MILTLVMTVWPPLTLTKSWTRPAGALSSELPPEKWKEGIGNATRLGKMTTNQWNGRLWSGHKQPCLGAKGDAGQDECAVFKWKWIRPRWHYSVLLGQTPIPQHLWPYVSGSCVFECRTHQSINQFRHTFADSSERIILASTVFTVWANMTSTDNFENVGMQMGCPLSEIVWCDRTTYNLHHACIQIASICSNRSLLSLVVQRTSRGLNLTRVYSTCKHNTNFYF